MQIIEGLALQIGGNAEVTSSPDGTQVRLEFGECRNYTGHAVRGFFAGFIFTEAMRILPRQG